MQAVLLTETIVPIMGQTETVVACAPVISWDIDALMDTPSIVLSRTLIDICREIKKINKCEHAYSWTQNYWYTPQIWI